MIGIILVTYNNEENLELLFSSIKKQSYQDFKVYLIDNGSKDSSVQSALDFYPDIVVEKLHQNEGFARASNLGAKIAISQGCKFIFILNNDVELDQNCIEELIKLIRKDDTVACVGPIVFRGIDQKRTNVIQEYGGHISFKKYEVSKNFMGIKISENVIPDSLSVDFIMGGALMIKADVINKIGLFDARYFMYGDEIDLFYRMKDFNYKMIVTKKAKLWHFHYSASNNIERYCFERYYIVRNKYLFYIKNRFYKEIWLSIIRDLFYSVFLYKRYLKRGQFVVFRYHLKGMVDGIRNIKGKSESIYT